LAKAVIPDSMTSIGENAFFGCESLTSITIPNGVTNIDENVFRNCESLTSITIPDSVTSIGRNAFAKCHNLISITIPKGLDITKAALPKRTKIIKINPENTSRHSLKTILRDGISRLRVNRIKKQTIPYKAEIER
jgi:hypothetical protein